MATHYNFPVFHPLSSRKLSHSSLFHLQHSHINHRHHCRYSTIVASTFKKPLRASRKVKSDADLCNDIRNFLSTVGLPQNHVPTTKELSNHGRSDLANLVRRRGYKLIRQLLETSPVENIVVSNIDTGQTVNLEVIGGSEGQNEKLKVLSVGVLSNESLQDVSLYSYVKTDVEVQLTDQSPVGAESNTLSLQEKVANFIKHGELDDIEDSGFRSTYEQHSDEGKNTESATSCEPELALSMLNGNVPSSAGEVVDPSFENSNSRNAYISTEQHTYIGQYEDLDDEKQKAESESEIERLKFLLHQKELELTQLKEQIEKEKHALSLLQTKAENEISRAQELIVEKESELHAAEETLCGLKEVEIQYSADGETVELAGSFNGWHHKILMEPLLSSSTTDTTGSRTSQVWRVVLWLYPGVYEIKFVVDGHWTTDPQRESITRNGAHNNILCVD